MDASQDHEGLVDVIASFVTDAQPSVLMQPTESALHHPTDCPQPRLFVGTAFRNHRFNSSNAQEQAMGRRVIRFVRKQAVRPSARPPTFPLHRGYGIDQGKQLGHVGDIGRRERCRQGNAIRIRDDVVFRAAFRTIGGIGAGFDPPKTARTLELSATARDQSILSACRRWLSRTWWRSIHTPACCQSRIRLQQVMPDPQPISWGKSSQGIPVRRTKRIPVSALRLSNGFRPGYRKRRLGCGRIGSIKAHKSSGTISFAIVGPPCPRMTSAKHATKEHSFC